MNTNQIKALKSAAKKKRENSIKKVNDSILKMKSEGLPISIGSVSTYAGVARSWIYNNPEIKSIIESNRINDDKISRIIDLKSQISTRNKIIDTLKNKNKILTAKNAALRKQLEVVYGQLYALEKR